MKGIYLTGIQRRHLIDVYLTQGFQAASPLALEYGIQPRSVASMTRKMGIKGKRGREPGKWKTAPKPRIRVKKPKPLRIKRWDDPRWKRAILIGAVVA